MVVRLCAGRDQFPAHRTTGARRSGIPAAGRPSEARSLDAERVPQAASESVERRVHASGGSGAEHGDGTVGAGGDRFDARGRERLGGPQRQAGTTATRTRAHPPAHQAVAETMRSGRAGTIGRPGGAARAVATAARADTAADGTAAKIRAAARFAQRSGEPLSAQARRFLVGLHGGNRGVGRPPGGGATRAPGARRFTVRWRRWPKRSSASAASGPLP
jgi:hypothetical protein